MMVMRREGRMAGADSLQGEPGETVGGVLPPGGRGQSPACLWKTCHPLPREVEVLRASFPATGPACLSGPMRRGARAVEAAEWCEDSVDSSRGGGGDWGVTAPARSQIWSVEGPPTRAQGGGCGGQAAGVLERGRGPPAPAELCAPEPGPLQRRVVPAGQPLPGRGVPQDSSPR